MTERNAIPEREELHEIERAATASKRKVERIKTDLDKERKRLYRLHDRARKVRRRMVGDRFVDLGEKAVKRGIDVMALNELAPDKREELFDRVLDVLHDGLGGTAIEDVAGTEGTVAKAGADGVPTGRRDDGDGALRKE